MGGIIDAFAKSVIFPVHHDKILFYRAVDATKQAIHSNRIMSEEEILAKEREKMLKKKKAALQQQMSNGTDKKNN